MGGIHVTYGYDSLLFHPAWCVMEFSKLDSHLMVDGGQHLFSCGQLFLTRLKLTGGELYLEEGT